MVVITRGEASLPAGVRRAGSLTQALTDHSAERELFIIGGAQVFASALPLADRIILTEVELAPQGDVFFPDLDPADWVERSRSASTSVNGIRFSIINYARKPAPSPGRSDLQPVPG
jgi:dihydrofolate reductase